MSRSETLSRPAWRAQVFRSDGTVRTEFTRCTGQHADGFEVRAWFQKVELGTGERAEYQIRPAGSSRFNTWGRKQAHENDPVEVNLKEGSAET